MKIKTFISVGFLLLLIFASCSEIKAQQKSDAKILITIQREACFGSCPIYSAQIYDDGTVIYNGKDNVGVIGEKRYKISQNKVKELIEAFGKIKYFSLKNKYEADEKGMSVTDLPMTTTSISFEGKQKKVINYYGAPKELEELENKIDKVAGLYEFIFAI
ncbi:MAG: DUF6438 domain-containing protein [Pyrinomonadaceae bacterium]